MSGNGKVPEPVDEQVTSPGPVGAAPVGAALLSRPDLGGSEAAGRRRYPRLDSRELAAVFIGGALGTLVRAAMAEGFPVAATAWPWPIFVVNVLAAFLLGYFVTRLQERLPLSSYRRPLVGTGLCGGLSTFSTMQVEIFKMIEAHAWGVVTSYTLASVSAGYMAIYLASAMVRRVRT
jgi:fluoride exporter